MSWLQRLNETHLTIITGDGNEFKPLWRNAKKTIRYNVEGFEFIGIEGTYVDRKKRSGTQYPVTLYFRGENCLDEARQFEISARDPRPWTIKHPFYDEIKVQPLELEQDDSNYDVSIINVTVWETISEQFPRKSVLPAKQIQNLKSDLDETVVEGFDIQPTTSLIQKANDAITDFNSSYQDLATTNETASDLKQLVSVAGTAANNLVSGPLNFVRQTQALINFPFQVAGTVRNKVDQLIEAIGTLKNTFINIDNPTSQDFKTYETLASSALGEVARSTTEPGENDYRRRRDVVRVIDKISNIHDQILDTYDQIGYDQDPAIALEIDNIVNVTLANLYAIAFEAKQERTITLNHDSNIIVMCHRFYGMSDENLERFIEENEIKRNEYLQLKAGRQLLWYV